jgi:hypothetical protein
MLSTNDFISQYETHTDEELYTIYMNKDGYSPEAQEALMIVLQKKGGLDELALRLQEKQVYNNEVNRIGREVVKMGQKNIDIDFIKTVMTSTILPPEKVNEIIDQAFEMATLDNEDRKIKPRTIVGSILAAIVASIVGGILCSLALIYAPPRMSLMIVGILIFGLILLCYGIVRLFTRQTQKNIVVLVATFISVVLSIFIGEFIATL